MKPKLLLNDTKLGEDKGKVSWYAEPPHRWQNQHRIVFAGGIKEVNFKKLASIYKEAMARITPTSVPVLAAEDETGIIGQIVYNQASDELLGFCAVKGPEHKSLDYFTVVVGNGKAITLL